MARVVRFLCVYVGGMSCLYAGECIRILICLVGSTEGDEAIPTSRPVNLNTSLSYTLSLLARIHYVYILTLARIAAMNYSPERLNPGLGRSP